MFCLFSKNNICTTKGNKNSTVSKGSAANGRGNDLLVFMSKRQSIIMNCVPGALSPKQISKQQPHTTVENEGNAVGIVQSETMR